MHYSITSFYTDEIDFRYITVYHAVTKIQNNVPLLLPISRFFLPISLISRGMKSESFKFDDTLQSEDKKSENEELKTDERDQRNNCIISSSG